MKNFIITKPKPLIHGVHFVPLLKFEKMNTVKYTFSSNILKNLVDELHAFRKQNSEFLETNGFLNKAPGYQKIGNILKQIEYEFINNGAILSVEYHNFDISINYDKDYIFINGNKLKLEKNSSFIYSLKKTKLVYSSETLFETIFEYILGFDVFKNSNSIFSSRLLHLILENVVCKSILKKCTELISENLDPGAKRVRNSAKMKVSSFLVFWFNPLKSIEENLKYFLLAQKSSSIYEHQELASRLFN